MGNQFWPRQISSFLKKKFQHESKPTNIPDGEDSNDRIRSVARTTARSGRLFSSYPGERPSGRRRFDGRFGVAMRFEHELDPLPPRTVEDVVRRTGTNLMDGHVQNLFDGLERRTVVKHHGTRPIISTSRIIGHDSSPKTDLMINRFALVSLLLPEGIDGRMTPGKLSTTLQRPSMNEPRVCTDPSRS